MKTRVLLFCLAVALLSFTASSAFAQYIPYLISYYGDVDPSTTGSCGTSLGTTYQWQVAAGNAALGLVVDDPAAIDGKAYRINDNTDLEQLQWRTNSTNIDSAYGATIVARVKTVSESSGGGNVGIQGSGLTSFYHWGGATGHVKETARGNETTVADGDDGYFILRVSSQGTGVKPSAGDPEPFNYADSNLNGNDGWSGTAGGEIFVLGNSVQIAGGWNTYAARDVLCDPDENGKITVIVMSKAGVAGTEGWVYSFFAIDGAGNTMGGWQGNCMNQTKGRVGGQATPLADLKTDGSWSELKMVIDCGLKSAEYFVDGVSIGTVPYYVANLNASGVNRLTSLRFESFNDSRTVAQSVLFDDIQMQGTAVSGRTVKMYLNENPVPVLTILNASNQGGTDSFIMGAASTAGLQDVYFDWIVGTAAGAFAPGEEAAVIGFDLPIDPVLCTTTGDARTAAPNEQVTLSNVIVTAIYYDYDDFGYIVARGFAVEDIADTMDGYTRVGPHGIRVVWGGIPTYVGETVNITGTVRTEDGEPVLYARNVEETGYKDPQLKPIAMNNKTSGGEYLPSSCVEPFTYANGSLNGKGGWFGPVTSRVAVSNNLVKVSGGWQSPEVAVKKLTLAAPSGDVEVKLKIKQGVGAENFWDVYVRGAAGSELAHWYGKGIDVTVKTSPTTAVSRNLTGNWDELKAVISASATTFYFNGSVMATVSRSGSTAVDSVEISRNARGATTDYVYFDDLTVSSPSSAVGLPTLGFLSTIYGTVTGLFIDGTWNDYFYVDDGSGLYDGNSEGYRGIRCRAAGNNQTSHLHSIPWLGDKVAVTGVMGLKSLNGKNVRYFWTWDYVTY